MSVAPSIKIPTTPSSTKGLPSKMSFMSGAPSPKNQTTPISPSTEVCSMTPDELEEEKKQCAWVELPSSTMGALIAFTINHKKILLTKCVGAYVVAAALQIILLYSVSKGLPLDLSASAPL